MYNQRSEIVKCTAYIDVNIWLYNQVENQDCPGRYDPFSLGCLNNIVCIGP